MIPHTTAREAAASPLPLPTPKRVGRKCTVCEHPAIAEIDQRLVDGVMHKTIAAEYGFDRASVSRHRARHLPRAALVEAAEGREAEEGIRGAALLQKASNLLSVAQAILSEARAEGVAGRGDALKAVRECARCIELLGKLVGDIDDRPTFNVLIGPQFQIVQVAILAALQPFPEARQAVLAALEHVGSASGT